MAFASPMRESGSRRGRTLLMAADEAVTKATASIARVWVDGADRCTDANRGVVAGSPIFARHNGPARRRHARWLCALCWSAVFSTSAVQSRSQLARGVIA